MDSYQGDSFMNGRRLRPATLEYALKNYPRVIAWLKLGKFDVSAPRSCDGNDVVEVRGHWKSEYHLAMTRGDYDKCLSIARIMTIPLFASDIEQDWFDRASAHIRQSFG